MLLKPKSNLAGQSAKTVLETEVGLPGSSRIDDHESRIAFIETEIADPTGTATSQIAILKANLSTEKGE